MPEIEIPNNWTPRPYQMPLWTYLQGGGLRAYAVWHRRAGKDDVCLHWAACSALTAVGNYWHMLPEAAQARKAIWTAINPHTGIKRIDEAFPMEIRAKTRDQEMMIEFVNGSTWQVLGSDNYNSQVGSAPRGIVFSEWALADPNAWAYLRPILAENGGWALFITTPRGRNHAKTMLDHAQKAEDWYCEVLDAHKTGVFNPQILDSELSEYISQFGKDEGAAKFNQEYMCSFDASLTGAYWGTEMIDAEKEGRITKVPVDHLAPVHAIFDFGIGASNSTAIWFVQMLGFEPHVIDYEEGNSGDIAHYGAVMKEKGYNYGTLFLPHDGNHKRLATGMSYEEQFQKMGFKTNVLPRVDSLAAAITATIPFLKICHFDKTRCEKGLDALRSYSREWDEKAKTFKRSPLHNWASHGSDAFRGAAQAYSMGLLKSGQYKNVSMSISLGGASSPMGI